MTNPPPPVALDGIRVINAGQILAAPFCATLLCEFGADVIKVEPPGRGEVSRGGISFEQENRGERAVTINFKHEDGKMLFRKLCDTADILIENYRPGTLERLGISPDSLRETNPGLIAVRFSGYGQTGPYKDRAGFDRVALGFSGMTYVTGDDDRRPVRPGYMVADYASGMFGAFGAVTALQARHHTGRGQDVDVALYEEHLADEWCARGGVRALGREPATERQLLSGRCAGRAVEDFRRARRDHQCNDAAGV